MQIAFVFTCRECGLDDVRVRWDSSHDEPVELRCPHCGHVSGELTPNYVFREEHFPSWEHEDSSL